MPTEHAQHCSDLHTVLPTSISTTRIVGRIKQVVEEYAESAIVLKTTFYDFTIYDCRPIYYDVFARLASAVNTEHVEHQRYCSFARTDYSSSPFKSVTGKRL